MSNKTAITSLEPVVKLIMAEDLRQEIDGKVNAMGVMPDRIIVMRIPKNQPDPTSDTPIGIRSLGFLFNVSNVREQTKISISIENTEKRQKISPENDFPMQKQGTSTNIILMMQPCMVSSFGKKKIILTIDGIDKEFDYEVRRQDLPPDSAMLINEDTTSKPKRPRRVTNPTTDSK